MHAFWSSVVETTDKFVFFCKKKKLSPSDRTFSTVASRSWPVSAPECSQKRGKHLCRTPSTTLLTLSKYRLAKRSFRKVNTDHFSKSF